MIIITTTHASCLNCRHTQRLGLVILIITCYYPSVLLSWLVYVLASINHLDKELSICLDLSGCFRACAFG